MNEKLPKSIISKCSECTKEFKYEGRLRDHYVSIHGKSKEDIKPESFQCDACKKDFSFKSALKRHKKENCQGEQNYRCKLCKKKFSLQSCLEKHAKKRHALKNNDKTTEKVPMIEPKSKVPTIEPKIKIVPKIYAADLQNKSDIESFSPKRYKSTHSIELDHDYLRPSTNHRIRYGNVKNIRNIFVQFVYLLVYVNLLVNQFHQCSQIFVA